MIKNYNHTLHFKQDVIYYIMNSKEFSLIIEGVVKDKRRNLYGCYNYLYCEQKSNRGRISRPRFNFKNIKRKNTSPTSIIEQTGKLPV